jgi:hypothetical protein
VWYEAAFKKGNVMNQERKNYLAQFIMSVFCESTDYIWRDVYYFRSNDLVSDSLKNHNLPRFIVKNVKSLCSFVIEENNNKSFSKILNKTIKYNMKKTSESLVENLIKNPNKEIIFSLEDDVDGFTADYLIEHYLFVATFRYFSCYHKTWLSSISPNFEILREGILYCFKNSFHNSQRNYISFLSLLNKREFNCNYTDLVSLLSKYKDLLNGNKLGHMLNSIMRQEDLYSAKYMKEIYDTLDEDEACTAVYLSKEIDLVQEGIVSDSSIISKTKEVYSEELNKPFATMSRESYYFLSKYYPERFNKIVGNIMVTKEREIALKTIKIAGEFSGVTKRIARYIRSETSESRALKAFSSVEKNIYLQDNLQEIMTQFSDVKHSMLLVRIIKSCPKEYLYLFISNKLVRDPNSDANYYFKRRSA